MENTRSTFDGHVQPILLYIKTGYVLSTIRLHAAMSILLRDSGHLQEFLQGTAIARRKGCLHPEAAKLHSLRSAHSQSLSSKSALPAFHPPHIALPTLSLPHLLVSMPTFLIASEIEHIFMFIGLWGYVVCDFLLVSFVHYSFGLFAFS